MELSEQALAKIQRIVASEVTNRLNGAINELDIDGRVKEASDAKFNELILKFSELRADHAALKRQCEEREARTKELEETLVEVKEKLSEAEEEREELRRELDDLEQYGRRKSIRIENIPIQEGTEETTDQLLETVKAKLNEIDVKIEDSDVIRLHRSSKPKKNKEGVTCAQTLLKLGNWKARERIAVVNKNARAKRKDIRVHNDLTQRRFQLLKYARDRTERAMARRYPNRDVRNNLRPEQKVYVFANIQSDLKFKIGQRTLSFNSYEEFDGMYEAEFRDIHSALSGPPPRGFEETSLSGPDLHHVTLMNH